MNDPLSFSEDAKRGGMFSEIIKRLGTVEKFMRDHLAVQHYIPATVPPLPKLATMFHDQSVVTVGNARVDQNLGTQNYAYFSYQNPAANGDTWTNGFYIRAGTYTFRILGVTNNNYGKLDIYVDNVLKISGIDFYSVGGVLNVVFSTAGVVISTDGYHTLKGVVNGRNGGSGGYLIGITKMWFEPAAY